VTCHIVVGRVFRRGRPPSSTHIAHSIRPS
jgi:hypothetical protein